jgi:transglutaminase-like putative cysteine protease
MRTAAREAQQVAREGLQSFPSRLMKLTSSVSFAVIAVTVMLFFVLPRTTRAALQAWIDPRFHLPGFAGSVTLGQIGEIRQKREPVMHVRLFGDDKPARLRWRGAALSKFSGRIWSANVKGKRYQTKKEMIPIVDDAQHRRSGKRLTFEVQLRPTGADTIFVPGIPEYLQIDVPSFFQTTAGTLFSSYLGSKMTRYSGYSFMEEPEAPGPPPYGADRDEYLGLPQKPDPRIRALMETWLAKTGTHPRDRAFELTKRLRDEYRYSTQLLDREVADPLSHFLFDRGKGHCEYFASALAVMLRLEQIPSRVVTGFYGGDYNSISGWYVVRAADAHSWVEAYIDGEGWITLDPTPAASERNNSFTWFARINELFDALETFWQDWVLSYNLEQQVSLAVQAEKTGASALSKWATELQAALTGVWARLKSWGSPVVLVGVGLTVMALLGPLLVPWLARRWIRRVQRKRLMEGKVTARDATLLYERMLEILRGRGVEKPAWVTPKEFAAMVAERNDGPAIDELTREYNALRFGNNRAGAARMVELLSALEAMPRA